MAQVSVKKQVCMRVATFVLSFVCVAFSARASSDIPNSSDQQQESNDTVLAVVCKGGKYGVINSKGEVVVPFIYSEMRNYSEGLAYAKHNNFVYFIDRNGEKILTCRGYFGDLHDGLIKVSKDGKFGFMNLSGQVVVPCKYDETDEFSEGMASVRIGEKCGYINTRGEEVVPCIYDSFFSEGDTYWNWGLRMDFHNELGIVKKDGKFGFVDKKGNVVIPIVYDGASAFQDGLAFVRKDGERLYINKRGSIVIRSQYGYSKDFHEGMACVQKGSGSNSEYGYINKQGNVVVPFRRDYVYTGVFNEGMAVISEKGTKIDPKVGFINKQGKIVIPLKFNEAKPFHCGVAAVNEKGKWGFIDANGGSIIPCEYDHVEDFTTVIRIDSE